MLVTAILLLPWVSYDAQAQTLESVFAKPATWNSPDFVRLWTRDAGDAAATISSGRLAASPQTKIFGMTPDDVHASFLRTGELHSIHVVFLDAGNFFGYGNSNLTPNQTLEEACKLFDKTFQERHQLVLSELSKLGAASYGELNLGAKSGLKLKAQFFKGAGIAARVYSYEHQLLMVSFFRSEAEAKSLPAVLTVEGNKTKAPVSALASLSSRQDASPEHRIPGIPMVLQGNRGYCGIAILSMLAQHFGLVLGAEELAAANGFAYGVDTNPDIREMFSQVAREAGYKSQRASKFELTQMKRSLDEGNPVVVFRRWSQERDYIHSLYASKIARGEKAELPPLNSDDRRSWPGKDAPAHASMINGYRDDKREVVFTESWGQQARNRRMRYEEMEATSYYAIYFFK